MGMRSRIVMAQIAFPVLLVLYGAGIFYAEKWLSISIPRNNLLLVFIPTVFIYALTAVSLGCLPACASGVTFGVVMLSWTCFLAKDIGLSPVEIVINLFGAGIAGGVAVFISRQAQKSGEASFSFMLSTFGVFYFVLFILPAVLSLFGVL